MKLFLQLPPKRGRRTFKVDKSFPTKFRITKRTLEVSEAFGLTIDDEKTLPIYRGLVIDILPGQVVYITGESGSGKSLLLKLLSEEMAKHEEFGGVVRLDGLSIDEDEVLVEGVGRSTEEAIRLLSLAGLNDAFLFTRRYGELSDGQRYRYRLAKAMDGQAKTWIFDEFCSILDRTTAKVVAYLVQKEARRRGASLLVATSHTDLAEDLSPDLMIEKGFGPAVRISQGSGGGGHECSLLREVRMEEGSLEDYRQLEAFHYLGSRGKGFYRYIFRAMLGEELAGVIVYGPPHAALRERHNVLPEYHPSTAPSWREHLKRINRDFVRIWRVIIAPKFRGIGLGVKLVKETLALPKKPYVEALAIMAKYNPFFELAGMVRPGRGGSGPEDERGTAHAQEGLKALLARWGFDPQLMRSRSYNLKVLERLDEAKVKELLKFLRSKGLAGSYGRPSGLLRRAQRGDRKSLAELLSRIRHRPIYLIWRNPEFPESPHLRL